jgi:hypothetical protein
MEPDGISDIEGKVARVATSKLGNERVSNSTSAHSTLVVFGCRNACGLVDRIDIVEVDDCDFRLVDGTAAIFFIRRFNDLTFQRITRR